MNGVVTGTALTNIGTDRAYTEYHRIGPNADGVYGLDVANTRSGMKWSFTPLKSITPGRITFQSAGWQADDRLLLGQCGRHRERGDPRGRGRQADNTNAGTSSRFRRRRLNSAYFATIDRSIQRRLFSATATRLRHQVGGRLVAGFLGGLERAARGAGRASRCRSPGWRSSFRLRALTCPGVSCDLAPMFSPSGAYSPSERMRSAIRSIDSQRSLYCASNIRVQRVEHRALRRSQ